VLSRKRAAASAAQSWGTMLRRREERNCASTNTRLLGSVAFFPKRYGEDLIRVSLDILNRRAVPPAVFVEHKLITPGTVDRFTQTIA
jgi:ribose transport system substrate-binding protein